LQGPIDRGTLQRAENTARRHTTVPLNRRALLCRAVGAVATSVLPWADTWAQTPGEPAALIKKPVPASGELLTSIGIGTNRYGVGTDASARAALKTTLELFHQLGGQVIDTAEEYGSAETVLGDLITELGIGDDLFLASKVRMTGRAAGVHSIEQSFTRLRAERLDLMQVHDLIDLPTQLNTLRSLKAEGRIRYIGVTTARTGQHAELARIMEHEQIDFIQLSYSLEERSAADRLLPLAADRGIAVLANLPFGQGGLFGAVGERPLPEWAAEFDCTSWSQFFLKYITSHPAVTCAIPGTRRESHVLDNLGAARGRLPDAALRVRQEQFFDSLT
jgi:aryl-alcohol dehydrogenase-like predicted oxidoreductase